MINIFSVYSYGHASASIKDFDIKKIKSVFPDFNVLYVKIIENTYTGMLNKLF